MARRQRHDSWAKRAELYMKLGKEEKAMKLLQKMEEDDTKPIAKATATATASVPSNIDLDPNQFDAGGAGSDVDEDTGNNPTIKAACNPALDSDDDSSSSHPSQPSDDYRKVKKTPV